MVEKKIICPNCNFENEIEKVSCEKCKTKLKKKRNKLRGLFIVFILLLLTYPLIDIIEIPCNIKKSEFVEIPFSLIREVTTKTPVEKKICDTRGYKFSTLGGNVASLGNNVVPNLQLTNIEEQWGTYKINFSYIDNLKFPYEIYGGKELKEALESKKISVLDADFYSTNYEFLLGPGETILITNMTQKPNRDRTYWAIATIVEPSVINCYNKIEYINITENKTFIEYQKKEKIIFVKEYRKIKEIIGVKDFFEWVSILFLLLLIILLILKIREERIIKNNKEK